MHFMHHSVHTRLHSQIQLSGSLLLDFIYLANFYLWAAVIAVKYIQIYKAFLIVSISHGIYITRRLINTIIQLVIIYSNITRVDD